MKKTKQLEFPSDKKLDLDKQKKYAPYSFRVFIALHEKVSIGFALWAIMSFMFIIISVASITDRYELLMWISISLFSLYVLLVIIHYLRFLGWKERLPFVVSGWDELLAERSTLIGDNYRAAFIHIIPAKGTSNTQLTYLTAALKIHNEKQNQHIGKKDSFWESRTQWALLSKLEATGSVNSYGIGRIMNCLREECTEIEKRTHCIKEVRISFDKNDFKYSPRRRVM